MKLWQSRFNSQCKLSQQGLLDISEEITQSYAPHETHHQAELVLMPVDPINLYAYWNLKDYQTDNIINHIDKQLSLRIYSIPELSEHSDNIKLSFDIKVQGFQNQQKVHLPIAASAYSAVIGEINSDNSFSALATSDTIHVPRENPVPESRKNTVQIDNIEEDNLHTDNSLAEASETDSNLNHGESSLQINRTLDTAHIAESNPVTTSSSEPFIVKNYNGYGYDLKIYEYQCDSSSKTALSQSIAPKQAISAHMSRKTTKPNLKNISGLGRLL